MKQIDDIILNMQAKYGDLRPSEKKAADYIFSHKEEIAKLSLDKLAKNANISQPTVIRMLKALGYSGYKEFQYECMRVSVKENQTEENRKALYGYHIQRDTKVSEVLAQIASTTLDIIRNTLQSISAKSYQKIIDLLISAKNIEIYAVENSGAVANDLYTKLVYLGLKCHYTNDIYMQRMCASYLTNEDVAIGISYSGSSKDTVDAMEEAKKQGAKTIVLTNVLDSPICAYADVLLCTSQEQHLYGDTLYSRTAQMMIVDMIYTGIIVSDYEKYVERLDRSSRILRDKAY